MDLSKLEQEVAVLDQLLKPIATQPVDVNDPDWAVKMLERVSPTDEAGVTDQAQAVLGALLTAYDGGDEVTRSVIRAIFRRFSSFEWAVFPLGPADTVDRVRRQLVHLSAVDQSRDTRDWLLNLWHLYDEAKQAGIAIDPILVEVAEMSSAQERYGMGSTRELLLRCVSR